MGKKIVSVVIFLAVFFGIRYGMDYYQKYSNAKQLNQEITALRETAREAYPDDHESVALQKAAVKSLEENLNSKASDEEKLQTAAGSFFGFYLVNYRQRTDYCKDQGVDITSFANAFKQAHTNEFAIAEKALSTTTADLDELFATIQPQIVSVIEQDMEYIASENDMSIADACQLISDHADVLVPEMHMSVIQPAVHKVLVSGQ